MWRTEEQEEEEEGGEERFCGGRVSAGGLSVSRLLAFPSHGYHCCRPRPAPPSRGSCARPRFGYVRFALVHFPAPSYLECKSLLTPSVTDGGRSQARRIESGSGSAHKCTLKCLKTKEDLTPSLTDSGRSRQGGLRVEVDAKRKNRQNNIDEIRHPMLSSFTPSLTDGGRSRQGGLRVEVLFNSNC